MNYTPSNLEEFCLHIPEAEHLHIKGTFESKLVFKIAKRKHIQSLTNQYRNLKRCANLIIFKNYLIELSCLLCVNYDEDFYDIVYAYAKTSMRQGLKYTEILFDSTCPLL